MPGRGGARFADTNYRCRRLGTTLLAPYPACSDRLRSRFAPVRRWTRAAQGLSDLRNRHGGDLREAEGPFLRRTAPVRANALRAPARDIPPGRRAPGARRAEGGDSVLL